MVPYKYSSSEMRVLQPSQYSHYHNLQVVPYRNKLNARVEAQTLVQIKSV